MVVATGCSSSSSGSKSPADSGATEGAADAADAAAEDADAGIVDSGAPDVIVDPMNCVPPATLNNNLGIGGYCSPGAGQCSMAGPTGTPTICTADLAGTPAHGWFCTAPCTMSSTCGPGAACLTTTMGEQCIPTACDSLFPEAGVPFMMEAGTEGGATDSGTKDAEQPEAMADAPSGG
jgi:hypothetical protein